MNDCKLRNKCECSRANQLGHALWRTGQSALFVHMSNITAFRHKYWHANYSCVYVSEIRAMMNIAVPIDPLFIGVQRNSSIKYAINGLLCAVSMSWIITKTDHLLTNNNKPQFGIHELYVATIMSRCLYLCVLCAYRCSTRDVCSCVLYSDFLP